MLGRRPWGFAIGAVCALLVASCCGGDKKEPPSRWDKPPAAQTTAASTTTATASATATAAKTAEPKPVEGAALNKFFPADGVDGYKRVFTQEKTGYAEAKMQKGGKDAATVSISDTANNAEARGKFAQATDKLEGYPVLTQGKNASVVLVKDRWQVKVMSQSLDDASRKALLSKFNLSGLAAL